MCERNDAFENWNFIFDFISPEIFLLLSFFQRGHIYTSSGSFFIEPIEEYTTDNQNILHKISRESLPLEKVNLQQHRNGKVLVDEMGIHEDETGKIDDSIADEDLEDESFYNNNSTDDADAPVVACTTKDGKSK